MILNKNFKQQKKINFRFIIFLSQINIYDIYDIEIIFMKNIQLFFFYLKFN